VREICCLVYFLYQARHVISEQDLEENRNKQEKGKIVKEQISVFSPTGGISTLAQQKMPVTPETMFTVRQAMNAVSSPDGQYAAFVVVEWLPDHEKQRRRIWCSDISKGESRPLTKGTVSDTSPAWSPDSTALAFASKGSDPGSKLQVYVIAAQGGEARQVCHMPNGVSDITWSPDGSRLAFLSLEGDAPSEDPLVLQPGKGRFCRLWIVQTDGDTPEAVTPQGVSIWSYAWSPDGQQFAVYFAGGPEQTDWYRGQIGLVSAQGGLVRQISQLTCQAYGLTWSPDGSRIAYVAGEWSDPDRGGGDIFIQMLADGHVRNLTPGFDWSPSWCRWFPDGRHLLCAGSDGVASRVGILDEVTGAFTTLTQNIVLGDRNFPHLATTPDLRSFVATRSDQHPYDTWYGELLSANDGVREISWKRLSRLNPLVEETLVLNKGEHIRYESVDGWEIDGLITWPARREDGRLPPLIVRLHGGPSGVWLDDWDLYLSQMFAAAGFAVLRPNIRGGRGRGVAFANAVLGDMGGKDWSDVLRGVDALVERKLVDGERVGITGWSYGGFLTAWAVTQTNRFKAAVIGAGICDFHSFHAQTNIPDWDMRYLGQPPISPLTRPEIYRERSPITYAQYVSTPTLVVHGEKDPCVPVNQAYAFYRALVEGGVPTELVVYPREGHALAERKHLQDYYQRMLGWFQRYL
jgi:dipeptidyl aminopeptidase/acylaminoacyl peptidase